MACLFSAIAACVLHGMPGAGGDEPETPKPQKQRLGTSTVQVELRESSDSATFVVSGLPKLSLLQKLSPEDLQKTMTIRVNQPGTAPQPPALLGTYSISESELCFTSRFPLSASVQYRVELNPKTIDLHSEQRPLVFSVRPKEPKVPSKVSSVYPSADVLPENLLKFYIHFSSPMSRGEAYTRVHLFHDGKEVESPFLELGEELWDTEQKRFTLFIHPGRIKRGLKPREESGSPMVDGGEYELRIDSDWQGADLQPLQAAFVKQFRVVAADAKQPDPKQWKIIAPKANSIQSVSLTFDEPLDHAMLHRVIRLYDATHSAISGQVSISENETIWSFEPSLPWKSGSYSINIETTIEDVAGNNLARPFETTERPNADEEIVASNFSIAFTIQ